ncbi:hypothetical protein L2E82_50455 [Cichorium intybus]|nr:hypothetical protein L2E82_50455 [Cichorium intybus]
MESMILVAKNPWTKPSVPFSKPAPNSNASQFLVCLTKYESMRSLWMLACNVNMKGCRMLAKERRRFNIEVMKNEDGDDI